MHVFGTETHMTAVVAMAFKKRDIPQGAPVDSNTVANYFFTAQDKASNTVIH